MFNYTHLIDFPVIFRHVDMINFVTLQMCDAVKFTYQARYRVISREVG